MTVPSATAIGRATGLSLPTVCELLETGWRFVEADAVDGFIRDRQPPRIPVPAAPAPAR